MSDFTPEQTEDARRNPKVGDKWEKPNGSRWRVDGTYPGGVVVCGASVYGPDFLTWTRDATLVRRGV